MSNTQDFGTDDLNLATFIIGEGIEPKSMDNAIQERTEFLFPASDELFTLISDWFSRKNNAGIIRGFLELRRKVVVRTKIK